MKKLFPELDPYVIANPKKALIALHRDLKTNQHSSLSDAAGYTYALQFLMHDLVGRSHRIPRTPLIDLQSLYGNHPSPNGPDAEGGLFKFGDTLESLDSAGKVICSTGGDLRRLCRRSLIVDPRNDHNLLIAQFHLAMQRLHNRAFLDAPPGLSMIQQFEYARSFTLRAFWLAVKEDLLVELVDQRAHSYLVEQENTVFYGQGALEKFELPVEFTHGVTRFGHSLVNSHYAINQYRNISLKDMFGRTWLLDMGGRQSLTQEFVVDWRHLFYFKNYSEKLSGLPSSRNRRISSRRKIDLGFVSGMRAMPMPVNQDRPPLDVSESNSSSQVFGFESDIVVRNLNSGVRAQLAGGRALHEAVIKTFPAVVHEGLIPSEPLASHHTEHFESDFLKEPTLWFYILLEAQKNPNHGGKRLGPLGSLLFCDTVATSLRFSENNLLLPNDAGDTAVRMALVSARDPMQVNSARITFEDLLIYANPDYLFT